LLEKVILRNATDWLIFAEPLEVLATRHSVDVLPVLIEAEKCQDTAIVSASPELFFQLDGEQLVCKPMKGTAARGIYTGAIGYFGPDRQASFNVAIRPALVDKSTNDAVHGTGGGIVWDSEPGEEYRECLGKARILSAPHVESCDFELLETMLWTPNEGFLLLDKHLDRMRSSAAYFDFECDPALIESAFLQLAREMPRHQHRIRLLLRRDGRFQISESSLRVDKPDRPVRVVLARSPIDKNDPLIYHKTTRRDNYDEALQTAGGADDVLLWNEDGYITETTIANIIIRTDGELFTPPMDCGLLGGTYREYMLNTGQVKERNIKVSEVNSKTEIILINSVRRAYSGYLSESKIYPNERREMADVDLAFPFIVGRSASS